MVEKRGDEKKKSRKKKMSSKISLATADGGRLQRQQMKADSDGHEEGYCIENKMLIKNIPFYVCLWYISKTPRFKRSKLLMHGVKLILLSHRRCHLVRG